MESPYGLLGRVRMAWSALIRKDFLILMRDRRALVMLLVMPMAFIGIIGLSTGKLFAERSKQATLRLVLVDQAHTDLVSTIIDSLKQRDGIKLMTVERPEAALALVDDGDQGAAVLVGPLFQSRVNALELGDVLDPEKGRLADGLASIDIKIYARPTNLVARAIAEQLVFGIVMRAIIPEVAGRHPIARGYLQRFRSDASRSTADNDTDAAPRVARQTVPSDLPSTKETNIVYQIIVPGYTVLFAFFLITIMARSFLNEQERGTLLRMEASPNGTTTLLAGKATPYLLVSVAQGLLLFAFGRLLFGMSWGVHPWMLLPLIAATSLAATGLGLLTAVWVRTESQVAAYGNLIVIVFAGVSGCFMPRAWLPEFMRSLSLATPHAWALIGYDQALVSARPNLMRIASCCAVLCAFGIGLFALSWLRFRTRIHR